MTTPGKSLARSASLRVTLIVAVGIIVLSLSAMALQYRITANALEARQAFAHVPLAAPEDLAAADAVIFGTRS